MCQSLSRWGDGGAFLITPVFRPGALATAIGSFPHEDPDEAVDLVFQTMPDLPVWPQLPNRASDEGIIAQFIEGMPGIVWVASENHYFVASGRPTFDEELAQFFAAYLEIAEEGRLDLLDQFAISERHAAGLHAFLKRLENEKQVPTGRYLKGQVTGPLTFGLGLPDQAGRASYYNDHLRQAVVKLIGLKARWQIRQLKRFSANVIIFLDEPVMSTFGSPAMITVSRESVMNDLNDAIDAIHTEGALAGVHCCGNTDWSILLGTSIDILSFDAYDYGDSLFLYPDELRRFLARGGAVAWGVVPTSEKVLGESVAGLSYRVEQLMDRVSKINPEAGSARAISLVTPSCGTGSLPVEVATRVCWCLADVSRSIRESV